MSSSTELMVRFGIFGILFAVLAIAERLAPRRVNIVKRSTRWLTNLVITVLGSLVVRLMAFAAAPLVATAAAAWAEERHIGLFQLLELPGWVEVVLAITVLDFAIWVQHYASHHVSLLWRIHRVHHADRDFDVTTALRFHPIEIALSMLYKVVLVLALGPSVVAVIIFEVILNGCAVFNHSNLRLPTVLDAGLRLVLVTPDVHRVHHSVIPDELNSNFGFSITWWDRLLGTFRGQPRGDHENMTIGLRAYQESGPTRIGWSLTLPFVSSESSVDEREDGGIGS